MGYGTPHAWKLSVSVTAKFLRIDFHLNALAVPIVIFAKPRDRFQGLGTRKVPPMKQIKALLQHNRNNGESSRQSNSRAASPVETPSPSTTQTASLAAEVDAPVKVEQISSASLPASQAESVGNAGLASVT